MINKVGKIRDVAQATGLSIATISRVMNGADNVKATTREKVLQACEKLDYVPNPAARTLSTNRSKTIAAVVPTIENSVFDKYIAEIEKTLSLRGYSLVLAISHSDQQEESRAVRKLIGLGAEAFILTGSQHSQEILAMFARRTVPYVFTSIWNPNAANPTIGYDNHALAAKAIRFLASYGHKNIAVIHGPVADSDRTASRRSGALDACGGNLRIDFYETEPSVEGGKRAAESLLAANKSHSAILCFSDVLALGAYFSLFGAGMRIPDDISVMGFDNLDWSEHIVPSLTTINLPSEKMGAEVAEQLIGMLESRREIRSTLLNAEIIKRNSVRSI